LTKKEFIEVLAEKLEVSRIRAKEIYSKFEESIIEGTLDGGISLTGFLSTELVGTKSRKGRNPKTGEEISVPAGKKVKIKIGKTFKDAIK